MPDPCGAPRPFLGVLMLDTRFPRPLGDIGHPDSLARLGIPVRHRVVAQAAPMQAVRGTHALALEGFVTAARQLQDQGAAMITTSCGFLAMHQEALQRAVSVPVLSSALMWLGPLREQGLCPGVLTIDERALDARHFRGVGVVTLPPVQGVAPGCEFQRRILGNEATMDLAQAERDVVDAARGLVRAHPEVDSIVLECSNMPTYADAVRRATGLRVEHLLSWIQAQWLERVAGIGSTA